MRPEGGVPEGVERLVADVFRTTRSTLRFRLGDASDLDPPDSAGDRSQHRIAMGRHVKDPDASMVVAGAAAPSPIIWVEFDGETSVGVGVGWPDGEAGLALFVDLVQEQVLDEEIWGGWPFCPQHGSHLECELRDGIGVWVCPRGEVVARVGDLT